METEVEPQEEIVEIDPIRLQMFQEQLRSEQNLAAGVAAGLVAAIASAVVWALITAVTNFQIGFMAVGVGYLVGFAVGTFGKGINTYFGIAGAVLALAGCILGNVLAACIQVSKELEIPLTNVISSLNPELIGILMETWFGPIDLLFYGLAVYGGYRMSFRKVSLEEIERLAVT